MGPCFFIILELVAFCFRGSRIVQTGVSVFLQTSQYVDLTSQLRYLSNETNENNLETQRNFEQKIIVQLKCIGFLYITKTH